MAAIPCVPYLMIAIRAIRYVAATVREGMRQERAPTHCVPCVRVFASFVEKALTAFSDLRAGQCSLCIGFRSGIVIPQLARTPDDSRHS